MTFPVWCANTSYRASPGIELHHLAGRDPVGRLSIDLVLVVLRRRWHLRGWTCRRALVGGTLAVSASDVSLIEQGDGGSSYATPYTVTATGSTEAALSPDTRCPNPPPWR